MTYTEIEHIPAGLNDYEQEREQEIAAAQAAAGGPGCVPWCKHHTTFEDMPGSCFSDPRGIHAEGAFLVDEHNEWGRRIWWPGAENATPDEAEAFARELLALVALARADKGG